jgi:hypothetical protein
MQPSRKAFARCLTEFGCEVYPSSRKLDIIFEHKFALKNIIDLFKGGCIGCDGRGVVLIEPVYF